MANSLDPDQARQNLRPDLDPNCLQRLPADGTGRQRVKTMEIILSEEEIVTLMELR